MSHAQEDDLLLLVYGELDEGAAATLERHLAECISCREQVIRLERGRVALDWATARPGRRVARWAAIGALAAAAAIAAVYFAGRPSPVERPAWPLPLEWSSTAGYVAGGQAVIALDSQLTRLEQEWSYVRP